MDNQTPESGDIREQVSIAKSSIHAAISKLRRKDGPDIEKSIEFMQMSLRHIDEITTTTLAANKALLDRLKAQKGRIMTTQSDLGECTVTLSNQVDTSVVIQMHERKISMLEGQIKEITFLEEHRKRNHQISKERLKLRKASLKRSLRKLKEVKL